MQQNVIKETKMKYNYNRLFLRSLSCRWNDKFKLGVNLFHNIDIPPQQGPCLDFKFIFAKKYQGRKNDHRIGFKKNGNVFAENAFGAIVTLALA
jgi:hypothetical protein